MFFDIKWIEHSNYMWYLIEWWDIFVYYILTFQIKEVSKEIESQKHVLKSLEEDHSRAMYQIIEENKSKVDQLEKEKKYLNAEIVSLSDVFRVIKSLFKRKVTL